MAIKLNRTPIIPSPLNITAIQQVGPYLLNLVNALSSILRDEAASVNAVIDQITPTGPVPFKSYAKAALPSATTYLNNIIMVSDDVGGRTPAFSDGTNWRRVADRNIIS